MQKKAPSRDLAPMTKEDFLERFYDGKINYKLPSKYPENFCVCKSYTDGKKEIPLLHRDKVGTILRELYNTVKPVVKKFKLSLGLLVESAVTFKGVAWTRKIRIDFSMPALSGQKEEIIAYTSMIEIKIRNREFPQNQKKFLNKTTLLAIMLHELAHVRHMNHNIEFALFLQEIYQYAMTLGLFAEDEEHMIPSSRAWERRMFETKGNMTREELDSFFEGNTDAHGMDEHGEDWEHGDHNHEEEKDVKEDKVEGDKTVEKENTMKKNISGVVADDPQKGKEKIQKPKKESEEGKGKDLGRSKTKMLNKASTVKEERAKKIPTETVKLDKPRKTLDGKAKIVLQVKDNNTTKVMKPAKVVETIVKALDAVSREGEVLLNVAAPIEIGVEVLQEASYTETMI